MNYKEIPFDPAAREKYLVELIGDGSSNICDTDINKNQTWSSKKINEAINSSSVGSNIKLDASNFDNNLDTSITDVQKLADKINDMQFLDQEEVASIKTEISELPKYVVSSEEPIDVNLWLQII